MAPIIKVKDLNKTYDGSKQSVTALQGINFEIEQGDIFGMIGMSGAWKSTLVRCLNCLERPTEGTVEVNGQILNELKSKELREARKNISMIFQHFNLLMQKTVLDNICFSLRIAGKSKKQARERAMELLKIVELEDKAHSYPSQLSGGQKQRVAIARALANNPSILLCDEATSALDPQTTQSILALLKEINHKYGITIVIITHEMEVVQEICNKVAILDHGRLVEMGSVEEIFSAPKTKEAQKLVYSSNASIDQMEGKRCVRIVFRENSAFEPVICNMTLHFSTPVNILYANTSNLNGMAAGEMILQLPESAVIADKMIAYLRERKLVVEEVDNYVF